MTREEELKLKIKELTKIDNSYKKKVARLDAKREKIIRKIDDERIILRDEWKDKVKDLNPAILELWKLQAHTGIHSIVYNKDIPDCVHWDYYTIEKKITGGCTGDWYDGCRGCDENCHQRAREEWKKKYGIVEIKY